MENTMTISNRHLLPAEGLMDEPQHGSQFVRIFVDEKGSHSTSGQLLASCLVNLLCRQVDLIGGIEIVAPAAPGRIMLPNGAPALRFPECLPGIALWAVNGQVPVTVGKTERHAHHTICIGDVRDVIDCESDHRLFAVGDGWKAWVGTIDHAPRDVIPEGANPLGPFLAAALAAGEIFKRTRGIRRGRFLTASGYSLWSGETSPSWDALQDGPEIAGGNVLPPLHIVGAGAVGNGLAYVLANLALDEGYVVLIDDDSYDTTSLNRCFLAGCVDVEHPKVNALSTALRSAGIGTYPFPETLKAYVADGRVNLRPDVAGEIDGLRFGAVVSCVDKGASRQDIQGLAPRLLLGGSTLGLIARTNHYPDRAGAACLACYNPKEKDGEKIRVLEQKLRGMPEAEMAAYLQDNGIDPTIVEEYLAQPRCGMLGEAAIRDLATRGPAEFSVGFVSLGAALLLGAVLIRHLLFPKVLQRPDMTSLNFLTGGFMDARLAPDDACEWKCQERRRRAGEIATTSDIRDVSSRTSIG